MSFDSDWNINKYKTDHESEEHWLLRKRFIEAHKDKFPESQLVCLAQVFVNTEFMGCKYPEETMRLVAELSKDVANDYRKMKSCRLQRTFVKASDAAEAKAKEIGSNQKKSQNIIPCKRLIESEDEDDNRPKFNQNNYNNNKTKPINKKLKLDLFSDLPFKKFVLFDHGGRNAIRISGQKCSINVEEKEAVIDQKKTVFTIIDGKIVGTGTGKNMKEAKLQSFENAMKELKQNCYVIKPTANTDRIYIGKDNNEIYCNLKTSEGAKKEENVIDSSNIGYKMLKKLGWSGGGLGSNTQGMQKPIEFLIKNNRRGFGNKCETINEEYFREILQNYLISEDIRDLYFESSFTKEERTQLHLIASEKQLKSSSYGKESNRYLVVSKKSITPYTILEEILINENKMYINKYEVQVPQQKAHLFPKYFKSEN